MNWQAAQTVWHGRPSPPGSGNNAVHSTAVLAHTLTYHAVIGTDLLGPRCLLLHEFLARVTVLLLMPYALPFPCSLASHATYSSGSVCMVVDGRG